MTKDGSKASFLKKSKRMRTSNKKINGILKIAAVPVFLLLISAMGTFFYTETASAAAAATIYANSSTGNDTTGNGSSVSPYKTFHKGYTMAVSGDTLNLTGTFTWTDADETGDAATTGYTIGKNITIQGQGADTTIVQAASSENTADRRVFTIPLANTVTINSLTIRYGKVGSSQDGGGVYVDGIATINYADISYNRAPDGSGGGIDVRGSLTIQNSTIHHNVASYMGGGLNRDYYSGSGGTPGASDLLDIINCTISYNQVTQTVAYLEGGGVFFRRGQGSITNSTVAYNTIVNGGGASTHGVGTGDTGAIVRLKNNIIAVNTLTNCWSGEIGHRESGGGTYTDNGGNIIGKLGYYRGGFTAAVTTWVDQVDGCISPDGTYILQNGGSTSGQLNLNSTLALNSSLYGTMTHAITSAASIAVNNGLSGTNGSISVPSTDQRGLSRLSTTDIGAYEYGASSSVTLSVSKAGTGTGTVTATGISCGADCTETYSSGTSITLAGSADTGSTWNGWSGGTGSASICSGTGDCTFSITADSGVTATFTLNNYTVTYNGNTNTGGSVPTDGNTYHITDTVTVLGNTGSLVKTGYTFAGWNTAANGSGTGYSGGNTFAMGSSNVTLYAQWTANTYTLTYTAGANGSITGTSPQTVNHGANGTAVTAVPATGYHFVNWSDGSTANPRTDTNVTANITVTANFALDPSNCTYSVSPSSQSFNGNGGSGSFSISRNEGACDNDNWIVSTTSNWLTITQTTSGYGNGTVAYTVSANTTTGSRMGAIIVSGNNNTATHTVTQGALLTLTPQTLSYGTIKTSETAMLRVTITNTSGASLDIAGGISITGSNSSEFTYTSTCGTLMSNGSCTVDVTFGPVSAGAKTAQLTITANGIPFSVPLTGNAVVSGSDPIISTSPTGVNGMVDIEMGYSGVITITNTGTGTLIISSIALYGRDAVDFWITGDCSVILAGGSCSITLHSSYTSNEAKSASIVITSNASNSTQSSVPGGAMSYPAQAACTSSRSKIEIPINLTSYLCGSEMVIITPVSIMVTSDAVTGSIAVATSGTCQWKATRSVNWISMVGEDQWQSGNGGVVYTVSDNTGSAPRMGAIVIGGVQFAVIQYGPGTAGIFSDTSGGPFEDYIDVLSIEEVTKAVGSFSPEDITTRGMAAAFVIRALYGEGFGYTATPYYTDVPESHVFFKYVQKLKDDAITTVEGIYGVDDFLTRGEAAALIIRAIYGEDFYYTTAPYFSDVPEGHMFFKYAQKFKATGITLSEGIYRVDDYATRGMMAAFITRAFFRMK